MPSKKSKVSQLAVEAVPVSALTYHPRNYREHPEAQIDHLVQSIKEHGFYKNIVCAKDNTILAGHGAVQAAIKMGMSSVPVVKLPIGPDDPQALKILAGDNEIARLGIINDAGLTDLLKDIAEINVDGLLGTGWDEDAFFDRVQTPGANIEAEIPKPPKRPRSAIGDIYLCGKHRIMCGDSTAEDDISRLMDGAKADMVFTDPPYGVDYASKNAYLNAISPGNRIETPIENDGLNLQDTSDFIFRAFVQLKNILGPRASYYITAPQGGELLMMMMMQKAGLALRHMLIWAKNNHVLGRCDYNYKHEPILYGWVDRHDFYGKGDHRFSVWDIPKAQVNALHPTMKPVPLIANAVLNSSRAGSLIADIFMGSGSTLIACEQTGRICYGMEISPAYVDVVVERWEALTGKKATRMKAK